MNVLNMNLQLKNMEKATFSLEGYHFQEISLCLDGLESSPTLSINFNPQGEFIKSESVYNLKFSFNAKPENTENSVVKVVCKATFKFQNVKTLEDIPDYFYPNSIAIIYPYVRALVSTLTLQANVKPILLPTMNLSSLKDDLKANTIVK